jgi:riboflavin synthase
MFTGIVNELATVVSVAKPARKTARLTVKLRKSMKKVGIGDSLSVNGVCLTVTNNRKGTVSFDTIQETLRVTNLGELIQGSKVNIERSLSLSDAIEGHILTGHVDGTGRISRVEHLGDGSLKLWIRSSIELVSLMTPKGAVAVDGISLTLVDVAKDSFSLCLIPHTLSTTTLGFKGIGDSLNIELDLIEKYVRKSLEQMKNLGPLALAAEHNFDDKPVLSPK